MRPVESEALIDARSATVWDIITDAGNYTVWDSGITDIRGTLSDGGIIRVRTRLGGNRSFRLRVRQVPGEMMTWTGGLPLGLVRGVRTFTLTSREAMTHLRVEEELSGPLLGLIGRTRPDLERSVTGYLNAVKKRAEILD